MRTLTKSAPTFAVGGHLPRAGDPRLTKRVFPRRLGQRVRIRSSIRTPRLADEYADPKNVPHRVADAPPPGGPRRGSLCLTRARGSREGGRRLDRAHAGDRDRRRADLSTYVRPGVDGFLRLAPDPAGLAGVDGPVASPIVQLADG